MQNERFNVEIDEKSGFITKLSNILDNDDMNWSAADGNWGRIHKKNWDSDVNNLTGCFGELEGRKIEFVSADIHKEKSVVSYTSDELSVTVTRYFANNGNLIENYKIKNISKTVVCVNRDNFGIEVPFNDRYFGADECMKHHCNTHIWCGHNIAWVNALKMGPSKINLGLYLNKGAIDCYEQNMCGYDSRGIFVFCPESMLLKAGDEYEIEWELFWHEGTDDFLNKIETFKSHIKIDAKHFTVFENENIDFRITSNEKPQVVLENKTIDVKNENGSWHILYKPERIGEHKFEIKSGTKSTWAKFMVKSDFKTLLEKRVNFIVDHQQCMDKESPLYGAFLIYDNEYDAVYFDDSTHDHNACRERMNISLLLIKYLQFKEDKKVRAAIDRFIDFVFREIYEETTGEVFNTIGKNRNRIRLYNAPGIMIIFSEMYHLTHDEKYLKNILKMADHYYSIGGEKCYTNGLWIERIMSALKIAGDDVGAEKMKNYYRLHVNNMISNGINYPPHEVKYEQTIVTPTVMYISEFGMLCDNKEYWRKEVEKHLECLQRFSGMQPDYHLNEIAIRYWDDYWFGKERTKGDTLPHHLSVLTSRAYRSYFKLSGNEEYLKRSEECVRNCMCLIKDDGRGAAAYVYPYKLNGKRGEFLDPWADDQDLVLHDALLLSQYSDAFKI